MSKIFSKTILLSAVTSIIFIFSCEKSEPNTVIKTIISPIPDTVKDDFQKDVLVELNKLRAKGCECKSTTQSQIFPPQALLDWDDLLAKTASKHSQDMYFNKYLSHTSLTGTDVVQRAKVQGFVGNVVGENLANDYFTVADVMKAWVTSYSHCTTMMNPDARILGVAKYQSKWTMVLGVK
ncbi:MAG: CAP domain-containing protein [Pseudarcicella sp.]|nr:CAP domain-containing protein [Pseudarcicella sp.]MBP6410872.1 CAP domain-containing protein [Pseudarcicella sp.]